MTERPSPAATPEQLLELKDQIVESWRQLPPEHQASMVLVLYTQVLAGEFGPWLRSSARLMEQRDPGQPLRFLPVVRLTPGHLSQANLSDEEIAQLNDEDLRYISHEIVRHYTDDVFWQELEFMARKTLDEKRQRGRQGGA